MDQTNAAALLLALLETQSIATAIVDRSWDGALFGVRETARAADELRTEVNALRRRIVSSGFNPMTGEKTH